MCLFNISEAQEHTALLEELKETIARENLTGAMFDFPNNKEIQYLVRN